MIGTVTVNPSIDQHIVIEKLVKDDALKALEIRRDPGGKGINVSRAVKELGGETLAFGLAGGCAGYMLKSLMSDRGVRFEAVEVLGETRMNVIVTDRSDRTQTRISAPGPRVTLNDIEQLASKITAVEPFPEWWAIGGSLPSDMPQDFYARLIQIIHDRGGRCFLDTDNEALLAGIKAKPFFIKPNEYEFSRLVGRDLPDEASLIEAAQEILGQGVKIVAITLGKKGALIVAGDQAFKATTPQVDVKSKVGAGDSFLAGCIVGLSKGLSIKEAIRLGMAAGTAAVMHEGTQLCQRGDVEKILSRIGIEQLEVSKPRPQPKQISLAQDVVCGMEVDPSVVSFSSKYEGQVYSFCSLACLDKFEKNPGQFLNPAGKGIGSR